MALIEPLNRLLAWPFIALIYGYRYTLSPFIGQQCRFHPTCSAYALEALRTRGLWPGLWLTVHRLARCQPMCAGGFDPVPSHNEEQR
ncbi:MAG: membrane protein insertion efficiency factor YidD [Pseudomonadota bacterium]